MAKTIRILTLFWMLSSSVIGSSADYKIIDKLIVSGMRSVSSRKIGAVIVHSTFNNSGGDKYDIDLIIKQFSHYRVSAHYVIGREGTVYRLVKENNVAFHAGKSELPNGHKNLNAYSIGIELINSFEDSPTALQLTTLKALVEDISKRHKIDYLLRHSDIAPGRKTDPWNMNWEAFLTKVQPLGIQLTQNKK
jgi:N-acetyl-anhydromuramyl-L-alanine amidase AmpD